MESVIKLLTDTMEKASIGLKKANAGHITRIKVEKGLLQLIGHLKFVSGVQVKTETIKDESGPVTNFFGEPLSVQLVDKQDLSAKEIEKNKLLEKTDALQLRIKDLSPKQVLENYPVSTDELVLRLLGKRAGIEDFKEAEIDEEFISSIKIGLLAKQKQYEIEEKNRIDLAKSDFDEAGNK